MNLTFRWLAALVLTAGYAFSEPVQLGPNQNPPGFVRIGEALSGSDLVLTQVDVIRNTTSTLHVPIQGSFNAIKDHPVVSPDDYSAAIPIPTDANGVLVCVLRNIRAPSFNQMSWYWLPERDPATSDPEIRIVSPPRFLNAHDLWVLEGTADGNPNRLARYRLGPTFPIFLGASDLAHTYDGRAIVCRDWLIHDSRAVVLQQRDLHQHGIDVLRFKIDGTVESEFPVNDEGWATYRPSILGIAPVPAHPDWGFLQYSVGNDGRSVAQFIDLTSGAKTKAQDASQDFSSLVGRISPDGRLALFRDPYNLNTLRPVKMPTIIRERDLETLPPVADFFCGGGGDSLPADDGYLVTALSGSGGSGPGCDKVHRTHLNSAGQLEIVSITADTGHGPFLFGGSNGGGPYGVDAPTFVYHGLNRLYSLSGFTGHTLLRLNVTTMTYGPETMTLSNYTPVMFF